MKPFSVWVQLEEDYTSKKEDVVLYTIPKGTIGFIKEDMIHGYQDLCVYFPSAVVEFSRVAHLIQPAPTHDIEDCLQTIRGFHGHYGKGTDFEFNIKFYHWNNPDIVDSIPFPQLINDYHHQVLEQELRYTIEELKDVVDWFGSHYTAGRMGGWLVLRPDSNYHNYDALYEDWDTFKTVVGYYKNEEDTDSLEASYQGSLHNLKQTEEAIRSLAFELTWIQELIDDRKKGLAEYMKTHECWEAFFDHPDVQEYLSEQEEKLNV